MKNSPFDPDAADLYLHSPYHSPPTHKRSFATTSLPKSQLFHQAHTIGLSPLAMSSGQPVVKSRPPSRPQRRAPSRRPCRAPSRPQLRPRLRSHLRQQSHRQYRQVARLSIQRIHIWANAKKSAESRDIRIIGIVSTVVIFTFKTQRRVKANVMGAAVLETGIILGTAKQAVASPQPCRRQCQRRQYQRRQCQRRHCQRQCHCQRRLLRPLSPPRSSAAATSAATSAAVSAAAASCSSARS